MAYAHSKTVVRANEFYEHTDGHNTFTTHK